MATSAVYYRNVSIVLINTCLLLLPWTQTCTVMHTCLVKCTLPPLCQTMCFIPRKLPDAGTQLGLVCDELRISYAAYAVLSVWYVGRGSWHRRGLSSGVLIGAAPCVSSGICLPLFPEVAVNTGLRGVAEVMDDD